jgi:hypothetical protein
MDSLKNRVFIILISFCFLTTTLFSYSKGYELCKKLKLKPQTKASKQWERILSNSNNLSSIGASQLSDDELELLKEYLVEYAADSQNATVPGK